MKTRLKQLGITKNGLAVMLRVAPVTVYSWETFPGYAEAYLDLLDEYNELRKSIKDFAREL